MCRCFRKLLCWFNFSLLVVACSCGEAQADNWLFRLFFGGKKKQEAVVPNGGVPTGKDLSEKREELSKEDRFAMPANKRVRFDRYCKTWFKQFGVNEDSNCINIDTWKDYLKLLCEIGKMSEIDSRMSVAFIDAVYAVLFFEEGDGKRNFLKEEFVIKTDDHDVKTSRGYCLLLLLKGVVTEFCGVAKQDLNVWDVWGTYLNFITQVSASLKELEKFFDSDDDRLGAVEVEKKVREDLENLLLDDRIAMRSTCDNLENVLYGVEQQKGKVLLEYNLFTQSLLEKLNENLEKKKLINEQLERWLENFTPECLKKLMEEVPFFTARADENSNFCCFRVGNMEEDKIFVSYFISLETLIEKDFNIAQFFSALPRDRKYQYSLINSDGSCLNIDPWEGPGRSLDERVKKSYELLELVKSRKISSIESPTSLALSGICDADKLGNTSDGNQEKALICYDSSTKSFTLPGKEIRFAMLWNDYYRDNGEKGVYKFVINDSKNVQFFEYSENGSKITYRIYICASNAVLLDVLKTVTGELEKYYEGFENRIGRIDFNLEKGFCFDNCDLRRRRLVTTIANKLAAEGVVEPIEEKVKANTDFTVAYFGMKNGKPWTEEIEKRLNKLWKEIEESTLTNAKKLEEELENQLKEQLKKQYGVEYEVVYQEVCKKMQAFFSDECRCNPIQLLKNSYDVCSPEDIQEVRELLWKIKDIAIKDVEEERLQAKIESFLKNVDQVNADYLEAEDLSKLDEIKKTINAEGVEISESQVDQLLDLLKHAKENEANYVAEQKRLEEERKQREELEAQAKAEAEREAEEARQRQLEAERKAKEAEEARIAKEKAKEQQRLRSQLEELSGQLSGLEAYLTEEERAFIAGLRFESVELTEDQVDQVRDLVTKAQEAKRKKADEFKGFLGSAILDEIEKLYPGDRIAHKTISRYIKPGQYYSTAPDDLGQKRKTMVVSALEALKENNLKKL